MKVYLMFLNENLKYKKILLILHKVSVILFTVQGLMIVRTYL